MTKLSGKINGIKLTLSDRIFNAGVHTFLLLSGIIILVPIINIIAISFSSYISVISGKVWIWPVGFHLECYKAVFSSNSIISGYINSFIYTFFGTVVNVVVTVMVAYPLSFSELKGRNVLTAVFAFTMLFSGGMVPTYMVVNKLKMIDTIWAMIIPSALSIWNMVIMRTFFQNSIPKEIYEAATIDGCSDMRYLFKIVIPLSGSIIAVISLYYAVFHWNSYFNAMLYLNSKSKYPLQLVLREILIIGSMDTSMAGSMDADLYREGAGELLKYAIIVVSSVPMLIVYMFVQKYFVKGIMIGAIKG